MGQANARKRAYEKAKAELLATCDADASIVANTAIRLFDNFILPKHYTGGCYLTTFTLHRFLEREHGINTTPIVGYVNDGTDDIMISHAWLEYCDRKIDLTLNIVEHSDVLNSGSLMVLDHAIRSGKVNHSYHLERPIQGLLAIQRMLDDPEVAPVVRHKEAEHLKMLAIRKSNDLIDAYLESAPSDLAYEVMAGAMR